MKSGYVYLKKTVLLLLIFISSTFMYSQQFLVNSEWSASIGNDTSNYFYKHATVKVDASSNIYTLGSSISTTGHDFLLMKQDYTGDTLFIVNWNGDGDGEDVAMDMIINNSTGDVYIVGGSVQNAYDSLDAVLVGFDDTGVEIGHTYSSDNSGYNDIYTAVAFDGTNIYACGSIGTNSDGHDYLISGFDHHCTEFYSETYDYVGLDDVALQITAAAGNSVVVAGVSEPTDSTWDYYIRIYKLSSSISYNGSYRNYAGSGQTHRPTDAVFKDNYYYVTGGVFNGVDYDIKTVCMDTALTVIWEQTWDGSGYYDISRSMKVDNDGNVFVTGSTGKSNYTTDMVTIKYDNAGNEMWVRQYDGNSDISNDVAFDLELFNDNVYITGHINGGSNFNTICYDTAGTWRWQKVSEIGLQYPTDMAIDGQGNVIIAGPYLYFLITEKYSVLEASLTPITDTSGTPLYREDEIIVSFNPAKINTAFIDNGQLQYAPIVDVLDSALIDAMEAKLGTPLRNDREVNIVKNISQKTTDTLSISRHGYDVKIPPFWATLTLRLPHTYDELTACDSLNKINDIYFAEPNAIVQLLGANDAHYTNDQTSLHPSFTYPDAHINIDTAWARVVGKEFVRVGLVDNGTWWSHEDFGGTSFTASKIEGGKNYVLAGSPPISNLSSSSSYFYWHGTPVAGIFGALRDNTLGIAGIAGGDPDSSSTGVALYDLIACCDANGYNSSGYVTRLSQAIYEGALSTGAGGFGLHVMNLSAGTYNYATSTLRQKTLFARDNGVVLVASRGNGSNQDSATYYPSCYKDEWILNVGGSGTDGHYKNGNVPINGSGNGFFGMANQNLWTYISKNMDFIAPQAYENVYTLEGNSPGNNDYISFGGTSSSAAHVSGVAALMLSYFNTNSPTDANLSIEDVEHILEYTAVDDIGGDATAGYDIYSGYGRVDGGKALQVIQRPYYKVLHFTSWLNSADMVQVGNDVQSFGNFYLNDLNYAGSPNVGATNVDVYKISGVVNHGSWISPAGIILGHWIRNTYCDAYDTCYTASGTPQADAHRFADFEYFNPDSAKLFGFLYDASGLYSWFPVNPNTGYVKLSYTVHVYDSTGQSFVENEEDMNINLFPNPSTDFVNLQFNMPKNGNAVMRVIDMNGRVVLALVNEMIESGVHNIPVSVHSLQQGMYFFEIAVDNKTTVKKFIKIE